MRLVDGGQAWWCVSGLNEIGEWTKGVWCDSGLKEHFWSLKLCFIHLKTASCACHIMCDRTIMYVVNAWESRTAESSPHVALVMQTMSLVLASGHNRQ